MDREVMAVSWVCMAAGIPARRAHLEHPRGAECDNRAVGCSTNSRGQKVIIVLQPQRR